MSKTPRIIQLHNCHELQRFLQDSDSYSNKNIGLQNKSEYISTIYKCIFGKTQRKEFKLVCMYNWKKRRT